MKQWLIGLFIATLTATIIFTILMFALAFGVVVLEALHTYF